MLSHHALNFAWGDRTLSWVCDLGAFYLYGNIYDHRSVYQSWALWEEGGEGHWPVQVTD